MIYRRVNNKYRPYNTITGCLLGPSPVKIDLRIVSILALTDPQPLWQRIYLQGWVHNIVLFSCVHGQWPLVVLAYSKQSPDSEKIPDSSISMESWLRQLNLLFVILCQPHWLSRDHLSKIWFFDQWYLLLRRACWGRPSREPLRQRRGSTYWDNANFFEYHKCKRSCHCLPWLHSWHKP